jgi:hypothetical protein
MFGQAHKALGCFESKIEEKQNKKDKNKKNENLDENMQIIKNPVVLKFPRFSMPIISISCGADHALALTLD